MSQLEPVAPTSATAAPHDPAPYNLPDDLTPAARKLCRALLAVATHARDARGYVETTTHVTLHLPVDLLAESLGCHRVTIRRAAKQLRAHGLIDSRPHVTTAPDISDKSDNVRDGTLWAVRLNPDEGAPARLTSEELRHQWRDLAGDRRRGRTAYRMVQAHRAAKMSQSENPPKDGFDLELLLAWAIPPKPVKPSLPDGDISGRADFEAIFDAQYAAPEARREKVRAGAQALASGLGDPGGLRFYRLLLWRLLRLPRNADGELSRVVYEQARRARADAAEGFARRPGALFTARLKRFDWYDELVRASGRVCPKSAA